MTILPSLMMQLHKCYYSSLICGIRTSKIKGKRFLIWLLFTLPPPFFRIMILKIWKFVRIMGAFKLKLLYLYRIHCRLCRHYNTIKHAYRCHHHALCSWCHSHHDRQDQIPHRWPQSHSLCCSQTFWRVSVRWTACTASAKAGS